MCSVGKTDQIKIDSSKLNNLLHSGNILIHKTYLCPSLVSFNIEREPGEGLVLAQCMLGGVLSSK